MYIATWMRALAGVALAAGMAGSAAAGSVADFYKGRQITHIVSYGAGGSYGLYSRLVANYIGKHIPGHPNVVVQYMPGAGGLKATNFMYNVAPKDGSRTALVTKDLVVAQLTRPKSAKFDARKFTWIGRVNSFVPVILAWAGRGADTIEDVKKHQVVMGVSGRSHHGFLLAAVMNQLIGTKFKLITGYRGAKAMNIAMESGEVDIRIASSMSLKTQLAAQMRDGKLKVLLQAGETKAPELSNVPLARDLLPPEDRSIVGLIDSGAFIGWSVMAPPGVPAARAQALGSALAAVVKDPGFLAAAHKAKVDIDPASGAALRKHVASVLATPADIVAKTRKLIGIKAAKKTKK